MSGVFPEHFFYGIANLAAEDIVDVFEQNIKDGFLYEYKNVSFLSSIQAYETDVYNIFVFGHILYFPKKFVFKDKSSGLLVEALILEYGLDFHKKIDGQYFIVLYDKLSDKWLFINNNHEATRMYYYLDELRFAWASSMRLLYSLVSFSVAFDKNAIPDFLSTGYHKTEKMQFKNVCRMLPSCYILFDKNGIKVSNTWQALYNIKRPKKIDFSAKAQQYENMFSENMKTYLNCAKTKNLGCFLSGGHDSSFIYSIAAQIYKKPIHTFTASIDGGQYDEAPKAKLVNDVYGGINHNVVVRANDLDYLPELIRICQEPVAGSSLPMYLCTLKAKEVVDTVFAGDGADPLWAEYYPVAAWHSVMKLLPYLGRKFMYKIAQLFRGVFNFECLWELEFVLRLFSKKDIYKQFYNRLCRYWHFDEQQLRSLLVSEEFDSVDLKMAIVQIPFTAKHFFDNLVQAKMLYGTSTYMVASTMQPVEYYGMHLYLPYLSKNIIQFINSLPAQALVEGNLMQLLSNSAKQKYFHLKVLEKYLPFDLVHTPKQGFHMPFHAFFNARPAVLDRLLKALKRRPWFSGLYLEKLFSEYKQQKINNMKTVEIKNHGYRIFILLSFEIWYREFFDTCGGFSDEKKQRIPLEDYLK